MDDMFRHIWIIGIKQSVSYIVLSLHTCNIPFKRDLFACIFVCGCFACMYAHHMRAKSKKSEENIGSPGTEVTESISHHVDAEI